MTMNYHYPRMWFCMYSDCAQSKRVAPFFGRLMPRFLSRSVNPAPFTLLCTHATFRLHCGGS